MFKVEVQLLMFIVWIDVIIVNRLMACYDYIDCMFDVYAHSYYACGYIGMFNTS